MFTRSIEGGWKFSREQGNRGFNRRKVRAGVEQRSNFGKICKISTKFALEKLFLGIAFYRETVNTMANTLAALKLVCSVRTSLNKHAKLGDCVIAKF